jgi:DNA segregation ATPase FtsK/SpoIIIE, S-DNA-T family
MPLAAVPTFRFSMFDPVHLGLDEHGEHVHVNLAERNMLLGGEPGAGKSSGLNLISAHDCKLILVDGRQVELGLWRACADMFIGPSITDAIAAFEAPSGTPAMTTCSPQAAARSPATW